MEVQGNSSSPSKEEGWAQTQVERNVENKTSDFMSDWFWIALLPADEEEVQTDVCRLAVICILLENKTNDYFCNIMVVFSQGITC